MCIRDSSLTISGFRLCKFSEAIATSKRDPKMVVSSANIANVVDLDVDMAAVQAIANKVLVIIRFLAGLLNV